ncbi:cytochrome d ubiquinol oxidase subunit II [Alloyangia pacifica]|uniref:Cytochrome bd-I ubiquinol oxidase subunit 2 apoprotein n=1 Tax=Alloyangia pacifica TaxID=311180 RepID=A0A1I6UUL3_9RHOB|nr:cytochrome d ubiquinol oxidase subunit II [Alloyangia pacifica]SDI53607.1 cytochrome bd-I ubiquinol oxidase subunit 2 apoprotein [Alloyangia pacifica]SFT05076.1 cytochrome bd-I ubiquinol oxidase subunit 2 apoprotein [Alloyangia pacifica]
MFGVELSFIWAGIIAFAVLVYVILDGFDLGVGILFPLARTEQDRDVMMNSVAPIWDGNETWLVLGGGGLFAVFPLAYAVVMPALYVPIILMLLALIFRGVAFEYRWRTKRWKRLWDFAFFGGSLVAGFSQGMALGGLVQGIEVVNRAYAGGWWDWLSPFSLLTGLAVATGYALLGATWLVMKLEGAIHDRMRRVAQPLGLATLVFLGLVSIFTPLQDEVYFERWFTGGSLAFVVVVPLLVLLCTAGLWKGLRGGGDRLPFFSALGFFVLGFIGIGISFYPMIVPPSLTIVEAAAPDSSLAFALVGTVILIPIILAYTAYAYWVFRGKIDPSEGYH